MSEGTALVQVETPRGTLWVEAALAPNVPRVAVERGAAERVAAERVAAEGAAGAGPEAEAILPVPHPGDLVELIRALVSLVEGGLADARPSKTTVQAGLKLTGETGSLAGWVLGKAAGEANLSLTLEWDRPTP